jgi:hypothetical protein
MRKFFLTAIAATMIVPVAMPMPAAAFDNGYYRGKTWRGKDGRVHCRRKNGTTGLIVGGAAGALIGREVDGGNNRTAGTILGAAAGALIGREADKSRGFRCR